MHGCQSSMIYVVLRGVRNELQGFVRLTEDAEALRVTLRAEGVPECGALRLLLLSGGEEGAAFDLGRMDAPREGSAALTRTFAPADLRLWDAVALAEDWPSGRLAAVGWLGGGEGPVWRLAEAAARFLAVPVE